MCARKVSDTPSPAASSAARVIRSPEDKCSTDRCKAAEFINVMREASHGDKCEGVIVEVSGIADPAVIGLLLDHWIDEHLFSVAAVVAAQVSGAVLMFAAERWRKKSATSASAILNPADLPAKRALGIGLMQCLALWPGTSRSMTTIVGGYFAGLPPARAAEFSFLLGFVTLTAATVYKGLQSGPAMIAVFGWPHVLLGIVVATVAAAAAVKFLVSYLSRHGLTVFAWYRLAVAAVLSALYFL